MFHDSFIYSSTLKPFIVNKISQIKFLTYPEFQQTAFSPQGSEEQGVEPLTPADWSLLAFSWSPRPNNGLPSKYSMPAAIHSEYL